MSANRSVQAAQRRRAAPSNEQGMSGRGPQPSINSAQMFANQVRPGPGPNIPPGRLAGQQAVKQQQQQYSQPGQPGQPNDKLSSVSKMTISQAITLITLRLGAIESKLLNTATDSGSIDIDFFQSILSRLDDLEKDKSTNPNSSSTLVSSNSNSDLTLLTQQLELVKQSVTQIKNSAITLVKENASLKNQTENLKREHYDMMNLLTNLQTMTTYNTDQIIELKTEQNNLFLEETNNLDLSNIDNLELYTGADADVNVNMKLLIETELNNETI